MPFEFEGAVAAVTGAASGIGRACALAFASEGADVVVSDFRDDDGRLVTKEVEELGRKALYVHADVSKIDDVNALVDASIDWQGRCDLFMSNAGIGMSGAPHSIPQEEWDRILAINLHSHIWAVRRVLPHMLERGSGHLVHTSSSAGTVGFASLIPYVVTKFGVAGLCESMAGFLHDRGVGVSVVCPLLVNTNIFDRSWAYPEEGAVDPMFEDGPMKDFARQMFAENGLSPEQVAGDVVTAVNENHLYVFPSPELKEMIEEKWRDPDEWVRQQAAGFKLQQEMGRQLTSQQ